MNKIITVLILSLISFQTLGQSKKRNQKKKNDFIEQIEKINSLLTEYATLSPFSDNEDRFNVTDSLGNEITTRLVKVLNDKRILNYSIESLFTVDEVMITKSADNRIYFFSIDEKTGGSYRTSKTILHYRLLNGTVKAALFEGEASEALATSIYKEIYILDSSTQKYFVLGGVQVCNTCRVSLAFTLQLGTDSIQTEVVAIYDGRYYDLEVFEYNNESKEFSFEYFSADNDDSLYGNDNEKKGLRHQYKNKFKFENGSFIQIEKCEFWLKKE